MGTSCSLSADGSVATISVQGKIGFDSRGDFHTAYESIGGKPREYVVDLSGVDDIDSSAIGMLLVLREHAEERDATLRVVNCGDQIYGILQVANLGRLFEIRRAA